MLQGKGRTAFAGLGSVRFWTVVGSGKPAAMMKDLSSIFLSQSNFAQVLKKINFMRFFASFFKTLNAH